LIGTTSTCMEAFGRNCKFDLLLYLANGPFSGH
jgi:hypothetical protein